MAYYALFFEHTNQTQINTMSCSPTRQGKITNCLRKKRMSKALRLRCSHLSGALDNKAFKGDSQRLAFLVCGGFGD
ncbi:hypothetical protein F0234_23810 [Vibrio splendidus]|uniref:DUF3265 domain-containing protein n=1 Tax=Vibrio splendidus TaxID=29497 RepID=A0A7Y4DCB9_VIBSP|nr:hypothetical protein [Vibrio splendidus]